jgi:hypothetical protein
MRATCLALIGASIFAAPAAAQLQTGSCLPGDTSVGCKHAPLFAPKPEVRSSAPGGATPPRTGVSAETAQSYFLTSGWMCAAPGAIKPLKSAQNPDPALIKSGQCIPGAKGTAALRIMEVSGDYAFVCSRMMPDQRPFPFLMCFYAMTEDLSDEAGNKPQQFIVSRQFP